MSKKIQTELRLEATAALQAEVEKELAVADPKEYVNLEELCSDCKCGRKEPNGD